MKRETILVPQGQNPMDMLSLLGEQTKSSWIFLHNNTEETLCNTATNVNCDHNDFSWSATEKHPARNLWFDFDKGSPWRETWVDVFCIDAEDIAFKTKSSDPEHIFFIKMKDE